MTVSAVGLSVLSIAPKLFPWRDYPLVFETTKVEPMTAQLHDPGNWEEAWRDHPEFSGIQSIRWRLLPPVLGHALHLSPGLYFTLPWLALPWLIALVGHYALRLGATAAQAWGACLLTGTSSVFFSATCAKGYFDVGYLLLLLPVAFSPSRPVVLAACLAGPWIDEKFLFMLPSCLALRWAWEDFDRTWLVTAAAGIAPYCLIRLAALLVGQDDSFARQLTMQATMFPHYAPALPEGWWYGFRLGWVLIGGGLWWSSRQLSARLRVALWLSFLGSVAAISFLAWDTTRSIAMVFPFLLIGLKEPKIARFALALGLLNLLLPAAYVWCGEPVTVPLPSWPTKGW